MLTDLEDFIIRLHECINLPQCGDLPRSIVNDIGSICGENLNTQAITYCISVFFKREKNLLTFLRKAISRDDLKVCKVDLLQFLNKFIHATGKEVLNYAPEIKETCILIFNSDKYSDVRCCTFSIIAQLLELSYGNVEIANKMNLSKLVDDYFLSLLNQSKLTSSVKANILVILGLICRYHPEVMMINSEKCLNLYLNTLKTEMNTKHHKADLNVIAGALEGINNYLYNFTQSTEEKSAHSVTIFEYMKRALLSSPEDLTRYAMPKAALELLSKHAEQFDEHIFNNYKDLFDRILQWAQHKNYDMKKIAYMALDSYYKQLAEMLKKKASTEQQKCKSIFMYFIQKFYADLTEEKDLKETIVAIKGFGAFAGPCREFIESKNVRIMFTLITDICERTFFAQQQNQTSQLMMMMDTFDEKIYLIPSFLESLACVCSQMQEDNLPEGSLNTLEKLIILAVENYNKLVKRYDYQISLVIARLLLALQIGKFSSYFDFVSRIIYQSMIRIFSYKTNYYLQSAQEMDYNNGADNGRMTPGGVNDADLVEEGVVQKSLANITSSDFVPFWSSLLNLTEFKELNAIGVHVNERKQLVRLIYDEYIQTIVKIMKKLDLNAVKIDADDKESATNLNESTNVGAASDLAVSSNPIAGLRPSRPKDFEIFINLVDFSRELLTHKNNELFEKWLFTLSKEIILLSSKYPLISGFYKLNTLCMRIAIKIGYFNRINDLARRNKSLNGSLNDDNEVDISSSSFQCEPSADEGCDSSLQFEKVNCFFLYKKYVKEICIRMRQFKDELLASCLEFILAQPRELVVYNLDEAFEALQMSLEIGLNYLPVADNALSSLEYWLHTLDLAKLRVYYSKVLTKFDDYLQLNMLNSRDDLDGDNVQMSEEKTLLLKLNNKGKQKRKIKLQKSRPAASSSENGELYEQIQVRILKILGRLAGEMSHCLFDQQNDQLVSWQSCDHLKFYVPFTDIKPTIYFDRFLPRVIYLALSSTNRQTKVNACELLHAIVVYMIGKSVTDPESMNASGSVKINKIYSKLYPALFKLACDVDSFARNLFQPLVMQMIHWYTGNKKYESADTVELLRCIMESLVDEKDAGLRDFSALALREFLKWSIKHTPLDKQQHSETAPVNVKSILKRIFNFLSHPNSSKRLGALLAWNSIYTIFREEETLVNKHIFELLYYLVESLALAEKDDKMCGTRDKCIQGLDHVERIIKVKSDVLNERNADRVKPPGWSESVLEVAVRWLMRQCGRFETECRHKCMQLVHKLAPALTGINETRDYFQLKYKLERERHFLARFEGSLDPKDTLNRDSLAHFKTLPDLGTDHFQLTHILTWLGMLTAPLDCYCWVFGERLLTPSQLFGNSSTTSQSCLWTSLRYFVEHILNYDLVQLMRRGDDSSYDVVCTPHEIDEYRRAKCTVLIRFIDFLTVMLATYPQESVTIIPADLLTNDRLFECVLDMCLDPNRVGFSLNELEVYTNLPGKTRTFLRLFVGHTPAHVINRFKTVCRELIDVKRRYKHLDEYMDALKRDQQSIDWLKLAQLVAGYQQLDECNVHSLSVDLNKRLFDHLLNDDETFANNELETETCAEAKRRLLGLSIELDRSNDSLIQIIDRYLFDRDGRMNKFFQYYKSELCPLMCRRYDSIIRYLTSKLGIQFAKSVGLLVSLVEYLCSDKSLKKSHGTKLVNQLYDSWQLFRDYWQASANAEHKLALINLLTKSLLIESASFQGRTSVNEMYMSLLLDRNVKLNVKAKLLDLLYFFADSPAPYQLKTHLSQFVTQLPLKSSELVKGEFIYNDYLNVVRKLLASLELSLSLDVFTTMVNIVCREREHSFEQEIAASFVRFVKRTDAAKQASLIDTYWNNGFKKFNDDENDPDQQQRKMCLFDKVVMVVLKYCEKPVFVDFACANIVYLVNILDGDLKETGFEANCSNKICANRIIELAYKRLHKDEIFFSSAKLCVTYETAKLGQVKDGKELTKEVLRKCRKNLSEEVKFMSNLKSSQLDSYNDHLRRLHCAAYNCLCALFIRTQTEPKLYLACLFKEDAAKREFIFEPLVDKLKKYTFSIETDKAEERKTKLISLRDEFREQSDAAGGASNDVSYIGSVGATNQSMTGNNQVTYMNTQNMYESSLSEELSVFDFTKQQTASTTFGSLASTAAANSYTSQLQKLELKRKYSGYFYRYDNASDENFKRDATIEIEIDELNQHESMCNFVELIQSLVVNKITPIYEKGQLPVDMPPWMSYLHRKVSDATTHENVNLFIIRGIINSKHVFRSYAKFWYAPLMGFLVNSSLAKCDLMDYFTLDLMVLLLSWHTVSLPQASEKKLINRLFETLIRRCFHENRPILKNNLELLKTMAELWREFIEVPVGLIYNFLSCVDQQNGPQSRIITGIQLFGLVLANRIEAYDYPVNLSSVEFYKCLIKCMKQSSKFVHAPAAEVVGLLLKHRQLIQRDTSDQTESDQTLTYLFEIIRELELNQFITCIHRIQLNYPAISERCMTKLIFNLPKLYGEFKLMCAESILSSVRVLEDPLFKTNTFMEMLTHRQSSLQLVCLRMIYELLSKQSEDELNRLLPFVCSFIHHSDVRCRYQTLLILIAVFESYQFKFSDTLVNDNIKKLTNETLLRALLDPNQGIRVMAQNFWTEKANMPSSTVDRMILILEKMYSPQTELEYLSYATNLLLEKTSKSPDYNRLIYENPLSECTFREYNLTADWKRRHEMMTPLFMDTINSMNGSLDAFTATASGAAANANYLRATQQQSLQFQPTQQADPAVAGRSGVYDWLTQSSMDTFQASLMSASISDTQSALLFNTNRKPAVKGSSLGKTDNSSSSHESDLDIYRLRRRFVRDNKVAQSKYFARKQNEKKDKDEELKRQFKLKRTSQVEKYRHYRIGDFPDIQIKFCELIAPLQALAQKDSQVAMILFESLFVSILSEISYLKDESEAQTILKNIELNFNKMFNSSEAYNPNFIASILEIALNHAKNFRLDIDYLSAACLSSLQQSLGIILVEEYLALEENCADELTNTAPSVKRIKLSNDAERSSDQSQLWIHLAKLYRSMNDYDSIKGIFTRKKHIVTSYTIDGFYYESNNDFFQARKCYLDALKAEDDVKVAELERDLWEESFLRCCNELTDWKMMCEYTTDETSLRELFTDANSIDGLFPYAFKSKLKIILQEDVDEQRKHDDLIKFIGGLDSDGKKYLEQTFCFEMAMINIHQKDYDAAKYYANLAIQKYLMEWSSINKTILQSRITKLQSLQAIVELNEFLKFIDANQTLTHELNKNVDHLMNQWSNSMPNMYSDPPYTWDDIITNRCIYYEYIEDKYYTNAGDDFEMSSFFDLDERENMNRARKNILNKLEKSKIHMKIKFAQAAQIQGYHKLALNRLQQTRSVMKSKSSHLADLQVNWIHCYLSTHLARSRASNNPDDSLNTFLGALVLKEILKYDKSDEFANRPDLFQDHCMLHANFSRFLIDSFINLSNAATDSKQVFVQINKDDRKRSQLVEYAKTNDLSNIEETIHKLMKHGVENLSKIKHELKGSLELSSYCDYFLRLVENEDEDEKGEEKIKMNSIEMIKGEFPQIVIEQLLNAMRLNSPEARKRFPRLLQIVEQYKGQTLACFVKHSSDVPCWMFLGWLSQMTALLDKREAKAVHKILDNISDEYPQAFVYPFKMSLEGFKFDSASTEQREFVARLRTKIDRMHIENQFIFALEQLNNPNLLFKDYYEEISSNFKNRDQYFRLFKELYFNLIDIDANDRAADFGAIRKNFSKFLRPHFTQEFGNECKNIHNMSETDLREKFKWLMGKVNDYSRSLKDGNLGDYSPWLRNFKRNLAKDLEIPGQYKGKSRPMPEYHVKIESFDERVLVMSSLRRPKCITIRGNDQKEHKFLVKSGEDQRQDERIEALFDVINDLLISDSKCYQRNLSLKTYQVIPMTSKLALIEWLPETKTLKSVMEELNLDEVTGRYYDFINSVSKDENRNFIEKFSLAYATYGRDLVVGEFDKIQNLVPWDFLRKYVRSLSSNTQAYFVLRNQFITSYAVASACQYVLGIGDRHLSNWMIDLKTGRAIGIDFGMAFGHATLNIPVPELMPIRLTRQILKLMAPLEQSGLFEATMVHILKALRENNDLLLCILDVFVKEPSIDWIGSATRIARKNLNEEMQQTMCLQYARSRVNSVKSKLYGINPCVITRDDLMSGIHKESRFLKHYINAALGADLATNDSARLLSQRSRILKEHGDKYRLTVEEQVKCIIEQSTDLNILGRTWLGWQPFI